MSNMSYCRMRNTLSDLRDCYHNMREDEMSRDEKEARAELIQLCQQIAEECEDLIDDKK